MKFIEKLTTLFTKQKIPPTQVEVPFAELHNFFTNAVEEKFDTVQPQIQFKLEKIYAERRGLHEDIESLKQQSFINDNIEGKVKQIALGNRDEFIKKLQHFIESLDFPSTITPEAVYSLCNTFPDKMETFSSQTAKQIEILRQFFGDSILSLSKHLNNIRMQVDMIQILLSKHNLSPDDHQEITQLINSYYDFMNQRSECVTEIDDNKQALEEAKRNKEIISKRMEELKQSNNYVELLNLQNEITQVRSRKKEIKTELENEFHSIEKILKKYEYNHPENPFLREYIEHPLEALQNDTDLSIQQALGEIKKKIESQEIQVSEALQDKFETFYRDYAHAKLKDYQTQLSVLDNKLSILTKKVSLINIGRELDDLSYKQSHQENKLDQLNSKLQKVNELYHSININDVEKKIKEAFRERFNYELTIVHEKA